jgi:hypothetical protein
MQFVNDSFFLNDSFYWLESHDSFSEWLVHFSHSFDLLAAMNSTAGLIRAPPLTQEKCSKRATTVCHICKIDHAAVSIEKKNTCSELIIDRMVQEWMQFIDCWMLWWTQLCKTKTYSLSSTNSNFGTNRLGCCSFQMILCLSPSRQSSNAFRQESFTI